MTAHNPDCAVQLNERSCAVISWWLRPVGLAFAPLIDRAYSCAVALRAIIFWTLGDFHSSNIDML